MIFATPRLISSSLLKSIVRASKFGWGKSAAVMRSEAPMTRAPRFRNARVTEEPSPPLAPVMKTTLSCIGRLSFQGAAPRMMSVSHSPNIYGGPLSYPCDGMYASAGILHVPDDSADWQGFP